VTSLNGQDHEAAGVVNVFPCVVTGCVLPFSGRGPLRAAPSPDLGVIPMRSTRPARLRRLVAVPAAALATVLVAALPASAHVTITPTTAAAGGSDLQLTFRVPNEESGASTTQVQIAFPTDHPIASVLVQPVPGWTAKVDTVTLATPLHTDDGDISQVVSQVTWSGGQIQPGQYGAFTVLFGLMPTTSQIAFKAVQTYSNGDVVRWIDLAQAGQPAPAHPAPVLALTKDSAAGSAPAAPPAATATTTAASSNGNGEATAALVLGALGLAAGLGALAVSLLKRRRS
jgi:uncharacterized protein YcnI